MIHKGIEFSVVATEVSGIWRWRFVINGETKTGRTEARLELLAIRRVKLKIDRELNRPAAARRELRRQR
jgi:hypothetical protein